MSEAEEADPERSCSGTAAPPSATGAVTMVSEAATTAAALPEAAKLMDAASSAAEGAALAAGVEAAVT